MNNHQTITRNFFLLLALIAALLASSCGTGRKAGGRSVKTRSADYLFEQMVRSQVKAEWFEGKAKVGYSDEYLSMGVSATIRMRKDSVLWLSVKKLGFEAARVMITTDSVYVLDRINNQYGVQSLTWVEKEYGLPADLHTLQMIFLGNPIFFNTRNLQSEVLETAYRLSHQDGAIETSYWLDGKDLRLQQMSFNDQRYQRSFDYQLKEYQSTADKQNFSYFRNLEIDSRETGKTQLEIRFSEIELNVPKSIRFDIPKKYTRIDLD